MMINKVNVGREAVMECKVNNLRSYKVRPDQDQNHQNTTISYKVKYLFVENVDHTFDQVQGET